MNRDNSSHLIEDLTTLHDQLSRLQKDKQQLSTSLEIITEHADLFENQLFEAQAQLEQQVSQNSAQIQVTQEQLDRERKAKQQLLQELNNLKQQLIVLEKEKKHLEISLETITEHADLFETQLLETQNSLEEKVTRRTQEIEERNLQLKEEIRQRLRIEAELRESKESAEHARAIAESSNRAKSSFLANMNHELRTPLNAILGYSEILEYEAVDAGYDKILPEINNIRIAGRHLLGLISDVLDITKIEAEKLELHLEHFDIRQLIDNVALIIRPSLRDNQLYIECPDDMGCMIADSVRTQQILQNLLSNAAKFTHNGHITLSVEKDEFQMIIFKIMDTGIGIPKEKLAGIFDAFSQVDDSYTRRYGGTGIGLTICRRLCRLMGGDIIVSSTLDVGSTFTVLLPEDCSTCNLS